MNLSKNNTARVLDNIASSSFWVELQLISEILRAITVEIRINEPQKSDASDVAKS